MLQKPDLPDQAKGVTWVGPEDKYCEASGLVHCVYVPQQASLATPVPVVVMVHGWAGNEGSMWIFRRLIPSGVAIITPRAPINLDDQSAVWFRYADTAHHPAIDSVKTAVATLADFLQELPYLYPIDPERLVLMGFSQGAMVCNALLLNHPQQVIGMASLAGSVPVGADGDEGPAMPDFPVFIAHGQRDKAIPIEEGRKTRTIYTQRGAHVTYGEYNVSHKMNMSGMQDLKAWLETVFRI